MAYFPGYGNDSPSWARRRSISAWNWSLGLSVLAVLSAAVGPIGVARADSAASGATEIAAKIATLTAGYQYRGQIYGSEFVRAVEFEPRDGLLVIEIDDAEETAPLTLLIPVRVADVDPVLGQFRDSGKPAIVMSCRPACIRSTAASPAQVIQRLSAGSDADLKFFRPRDTYALGCRPDRCEKIQDAIHDLATIAAQGAAPLAPDQSGTASPAAADDILARVNALTARLDYVEPAKSEADQQRGTQVISLRYATTLDPRQAELTIALRVEWFLVQASGDRRLLSTSDAATRIPLAQVSVTAASPIARQVSGSASQVLSQGLACREKKRCIETTAQTGRRSADTYRYRCDESKCPELKQALERLVASFGAP